MTYLGFTVFKDKLRDGSKRQTIRKLRKHPIVVGEKLYLYWHMRQKDCEKIAEATCTETFFITIQYYPAFPTTGDSPALRIDRHSLPSPWKDGRTLTDSEADDLARKDGFKDRWELGRMFFHMHEKSVDGNAIFQVIRW